MDNKQFKIGDSVEFNGYTCIISAFLNSDKTLTSEVTEWVSVVRITKELDFCQVIIHASLLSFPEERVRASDLTGLFH